MARRIVESEVIMRGLVAIQSRREYKPEGGKLGVYFGGVIQGVEGQLEFGTYDPAIQAHITLGTNIDIEWDEAPGKEYQGKPTVKRTVRQLYIDGKPIAEKQQQGKPYGGGYKDSPETRASIEVQTSVNDIVSMINAGKVAVDSALALKAMAWLHMKLDAVLGKPIPAAKPQDAAPVAQKAPIQAPRDLFAEEHQPPTENLKQAFWNACKRAGYSISTKQGIDSVKAWIAKAGKTNLPFDELSEDKQRELVSMMKAEELPE